MLNLTQGITVKTGHVFFFQKNDLQSGFSADWGLGTVGLGLVFKNLFQLAQAPKRP